MTRSHGYLLYVILIPSFMAACGDSVRDHSDRRRARAQEACEEAVLGHLSSRATAQFSGASEHVYYDSVGGAGVTGSVSTVSGDHKFACLLTPETDSTWTTSMARLLD